MNAGFPFPDTILYDFRASHPRDVFRRISKELERTDKINSRDLARLMIESEAIGDSGIGDGVAVVSVRAPSGVLTRRHCVLGKLAKPIAFKGSENQICDLVFVLLSSETETQAHIRDLSAIIRTLHDKDLLKSLRAESAPDRIMNMFYARETALYKAA